MGLTMKACLAVAILLTSFVVRADDYSFLLGEANNGRFNVLDDAPYLMIDRGPPGGAVDFRNEKYLVHFGSGKKLAYPLDGDRAELLLGEVEGRVRRMAVRRQGAIESGTRRSTLYHSSRGRKVQELVSGHRRSGTSRPIRRQGILRETVHPGRDAENAADFR
ncbi:MAG: hypothetical protein QM811_05355 [Pirellulales bacterium]